MSYRCLWEVMVTERWVVYAHWSFWWMCFAVTDLKGMAGQHVLVFTDIHRFYRHQKQFTDTTAASPHVWKCLWWCNCDVIWVTWTKSLCYKLELRSQAKHVILAAVYHMILHVEETSKHVGRASVLVVRKQWILDNNVDCIRFSYLTDLGGT